MDNIRILEEIGLKEVSKKTHIEVKHLKYIINSEFDKLNRANTIGFTKIISREYNLDFSDWLEEAKKYWDEYASVEEGPKIFIVEKPKKLPNILFIFLSILFLAIIVYGAYIFLDKKLNFFENPLLKNDTNYTYAQTPVVNEAKNTLVQEKIKSDTNMTKVIEQNQSSIVSPSVVMSKIKFNNTTNLVASSGNNQTITNDNNISSPNVDDFISPHSKLWVGVIYLDNFKRKSFLGDGNFSIDPSKNQLITTGHGNFTLYFKGVVTKYNSPQSIKLLIKDGNISVISIKKFKELNRGSLW